MTHAGAAKEGKGDDSMEGKLTEEQNKEIEDKITAYAKAGVYSISKKEQADFKRLVLEHEEIAKKVYRETVWSREHILMFLNAEGKGADIAKEEAGRLAYRYELKNCDDTETQAFQAWLAGDTDEMPEPLDFIQEWIKNEEETYFAAIEKMGGEYKRKVLAALQKEGLINQRTC